MRTFFEKYSYLGGILSAVSLAIPFVRLQNVTMTEAVGREDTVNISYSYPSFFDILIKATSGFLKGGLQSAEVIMVLLFYVFIAIVIIQSIALLRKKYKATLVTSVVLFSFATVLLLYLVTKTDAVIIIGYYLFLILQISLILFSYKPQIYAKDTAC